MTTMMLLMMIMMATTDMMMMIVVKSIDDDDDDVVDDDNDDNDEYNDDNDSDDHDNLKIHFKFQPLSKEDLSRWLRVLMVETATDSVPEGLEEYFVEGDEEEKDGNEAEYTDILTTSVWKSWVSVREGERQLK
jgi:hypothetical protein